MVTRKYLYEGQQYRTDSLQVRVTFSEIFCILVSMVLANAQLGYVRPKKEAAMRLSVVPDGILERVAMLLRLVPEPLVQTSWGMGMARCIIAGTRLGLFDALGNDGAMSARELAETLECSLAGTETLLNALNGGGYLEHREGKYSNRPVASKWLVKSSKSSLYDGILFLGDLWDLFSNLEDSVKTGKTADFHHGGKPPEFWRRYLRGLAALVELPSQEVSRRIRLPKPATRLLDVGGGHGVFSMAFCRQNDGLQADVFDLPQALEHGEEIVRERGMEERVHFRAGDLRATDWGSDYDAILFFSVIHNLTPEESQQAMLRAHDALRPGGMMVIFEAEHREHTGNLTETAGFSELLFFLTSGTRTCPESMIREWMSGGGFRNLKTRRLYTAPFTFVLTGIRS